MIQVTVRFFAGHREIVGATEQQRQLAPHTTAGALWEALTSEYPPLKDYTGRVMFAVNQEFAGPHKVLHNGDEVAYIPPVSGGTPANDAFAPFAITEQPLDPAPLVQWAQTPQDGAVVTFAGVVRDNFLGRPTARLTYEAYNGMAETVFQQIAEEAANLWEIGRVAVHHRVGVLEIGETAVLVVVAAPHRQAAFDAASYVMDRIKQVAPIWKHEQWADGKSEWRE